MKQRARVSRCQDVYMFSIQGPNAPAVVPGVTETICNFEPFLWGSRTLDVTRSKTAPDALTHFRYYLTDTGARYSESFL